MGWLEAQRISYWLNEVGEMGSRVRLADLGDDASKSDPSSSVWHVCGRFKRCIVCVDGGL